MGLKLIIDSLDDVDEKIQGLYKEDGDKFLLDVMNVRSHPSVTKLNGALEKERDARKLADKSLKKMESLTNGLDLDKLKEIDLDAYSDMTASLEKFKDEEKKRNNKKLKDKNEWEKLGKQLQDEFSDRVAELKKDHDGKIAVFQEKLDEVSKAKDEKITRMLSTLEKEMKNKEIISAIADEKGNRTILMPHIEKYVKVLQESDGEDFVARVIDEKGNARINDSGDPMTISEFVKELKDKKEFQGEGIFEKDKQSGGSGSGGNQGGDDANANNPFSKDSFNLTEQGKLYKKDPVEYKRLKALADKGK